MTSNSNTYFDECKDCEFRDCVDITTICLTNRLRLAKYKTGRELPLVREFMDESCYCYGFVRKER